MTRRRRVALAALVACAAACSSSPHPRASSSTTTAPAADTATTSTSCGAPPAAGTSTIHPTFGDRARTVVVHVPPSTGTRRVALVLNLHGSGSDAAQQEALSGMDGAADADGFVVAYPQADIRAGSGLDWNVPGVALAGGAAVPAGPRTTSRSCAG